MDPHLGRNEYPADRMAQLQASDKHVSLMAKIMNKVRLLYFKYTVGHVLLVIRWLIFSSAYK